MSKPAGSADPTLKRRKVDASTLLRDVRYRLPYLSQNALAAVMKWARETRDSLPDTGVSAASIRRARDAVGKDVVTPYGTLYKELLVPGVDPAHPVPIEITNPRALLYHVCQTSPFFSAD